MFWINYTTLREPIVSLIFVKLHSRLRGKPTYPERCRMGKEYRELGSYLVRDWIIKPNTQPRTVLVSTRMDIK